eukprot:TRINITY_DN5883_c0_g1_i2.p1 TRINITY_DN5883_c0_g1~~TRINITY_DN5883_c0_g1_i2.p1  ORF type:complete len:367 (-),score=92.05 TRINITY_DN5883_c0_g1_i2:214-1314(-)
MCIRDSKETVICKDVALAKNICQICLFDMDYQLPVQVRDELLGVTHGGDMDAADIPKSDVNNEYYWEGKRKEIEAFASDTTALRNAAESNDQKILSIARRQPYYERNRSKLCSFWCGGKCTRVNWGDCPYRPCNDDLRFPELNGFPELQAELAKVIEDEGVAGAQTKISDDIRTKLHESQCGNRDKKIQDRYYGSNDPLAGKMLGKYKENNMGLEPPTDTTITTLYVGGVTPEISEVDLKDQFYAYGEIKSIRMAPKANCGFVTYTTREAAEEAVAKLANRLVVKGVRLKLMWGKPQVRGGAAAGSTPAGVPLAPPPPPGFAAAPPVAAGGAFTMPKAPAPSKGGAEGGPEYASMNPQMFGSRRAV